MHEADPVPRFSETERLCLKLQGDCSKCENHDGTPCGVKYKLGLATRPRSTKTWDSAKPRDSIKKIVAKGPLGELILKTRIERNVSATAVAFALNLSGSAVSSIENGSRVPFLWEVWMLANNLRISLGEIFAARLQSLYTLGLTLRSEDKTFLLLEAASWAAELHEGQFRKGLNPKPYVTHPIRVAQLASDLKLPMPAQIAAMLHDILEDSEATAEQITEKFGQEVTDLVVLLTRQKEIPKSDYYRDIAKNSVATALKLLDRVDNLRDLCDTVKAGPAYRTWAQKYLDATIQDFGPLVDACEYPVILEMLARVKQDLLVLLQTPEQPQAV